MEYGLAVSVLNFGHLKKLESHQNEFIRRTFSASFRSAVKFMYHLVQQPSMNDHTSIMQAKLLKRSTDLPTTCFFKRHCLIYNLL
ncbi:hypothetical protein G6F37_012351 [Rhizopus arrhizus]|nr:hypothetical protein G6F38_012420 [Rhizopus arrhizus]KAG1144077.1 hypothetical protein G6F37_012351 [Rhizopus arrhizus]